ncbi:MAG: hypothetical protein WKF87_03670 [Chryseolinea sp.]
MIRSVLGLLILCTACQVGKIPCPKPDTVKLHKSFRHTPSSLISARATRDPVGENPSNDRPADARYVRNISVEEWDCPKPGAKRYMPKSVKENIRKNKKKFESDMKQGQQESDSLSSR